ncbi:MAG TPA: toll/interleukin-1 receptor domain-containing protein [Pyrinomonadaceae bacterium]|nr:toll/interleukin-1 receptor domain-containing protein [Pyrinomonadaceae bacterium]
MSTLSKLIFVSYARKDIERVRLICEKLKNLEFDLWFDQEDLVAGERWEDKIRDVINDSRIFLLFLSSSWVENRSYVQKELGIALEVLKEMPSDQVYIVPVRLDDCKVPRELSDLHWMDVWDDSQTDKLINALTTIIEGAPAEFFVLSPIILGDNSIKEASEKVLDTFYDILTRSFASDKVNQTAADGQEHSGMTFSSGVSAAPVLAMIHSHPGAPRDIAPKIRGIFTKRVSFASPFFKAVAGVMMLDFFVEKLKPTDLQSLRVSLAVTFLPLTEELPSEFGFVVAHKEMMTASEWQQLTSLYRGSG